MSGVHLSSISHRLGEQHPLADLNDARAEDLLSPGNGLAAFRTSDDEIWELAASACRGTLAGALASPDLLVYVAENDRDISTSLEFLVDAIGLHHIEYVAVNGNDCGNFGPALRVAADALLAGRCESVLVVLADRVDGNDRFMRNALSVFSDGSAACIVTLTAQDTAGPRFAVGAIANRTDVVPAGTEVNNLLWTVSLARGTVAEVVRQAGRKVREFTHVMFANYRVNSQKFLLSAMGGGNGQLLLGPIADNGHCFSADLLINLDVLARRQVIAPGDSVLASATGRHSWSMIAVEVLPTIAAPVSGGQAAE